MEAGRLYQSLRGRLYRRLPVLAVPLGLLDWRQGEAAGTDGAYFYAPPDWLAAADAEDAAAQRAARDAGPPVDARTA